MESERVLYIVKSIVDPQVEHEWSMWHTNSHVPGVLEEPGFVKATKFREAEPAGDKPVYWTIYEMRSMKAFQEYRASEAAKRLRSEHDVKFGGSTKLERFLLVETVELKSGRQV